MYLRARLNAGYSGASGHRSSKSFLFTRVMTAAHQPSGSRFSFQYSVRTFDPTRNASQGAIGLAEPDAGRGRG